MQDLLYSQSSGILELASNLSGLAHDNACLQQEKMQEVYETDSMDGSNESLSKKQ